MVLEYSIIIIEGGGGEEMGVADIIDLTGQRFGKLTVIRDDGRKWGQVYWLCECDCGNITHVSSRCLRLGQSKSCGCLVRTHGLSGTPEHRTWIRIHQRCYNPHNDNYAEYGGRGIVVDSRWSTFEQFYADMGPKPSSNHSIERMNVNGNYGPDNCCWATPMEQARNRRNNIMVTTPVGIYCLTEAARMYGLPENTLRHRICRDGWDHIRAVTTPRRKYKNS